MSNTYSLPPRKARICRIAGAIFLLAAVWTVTGVVGVALFPGTQVRCGDHGCAWIARPADLLEENQKAQVVASPAVERRFDAHMARPVIRLGLAGVTLIESGPFAVLLLGIGLALRRLGGGNGDPLAHAVPWLRRASLAAIVWAFAGQICTSLRASLLSDGTPEGAHWYILADFGEVGVGLLLAVAAYATMWALEAGLRAQRDLAEIV